MKTSIKVTTWLTALLCGLGFGLGAEPGSARDVYELQTVVPVALPDGARDFGAVLAMTGSVAVAASDTEELAYVYIERAPGLWLERASLDTGVSNFRPRGAAIAGPDDAGRYTVAIAGSEHFGTNERVVLFVGSGSRWTRVASLPAPSLSYESIYGIPIDMEPGRIVVAGLSSAYVYEKTAGGWSKSAEIGLPTYLFKRGVALAGSSIAVGSPNVDAGGAVLIFEQAAGIWRHESSVSRSVAGEWSEKFGSAVDLDGDTLLVGAPEASANGAAYVFTRTADAWRLEATIESPSSSSESLFGQAVSLDGNVAIISAKRDSGLTGAVYVYGRGFGRGGSTTWQYRATLRSSQDEPKDDFGNRIVLDNDTILVGAPNLTTRTSRDGGVLVYECSTKGIDCWNYQ